jgi:hypothetical protein
MNVTQRHVTCRLPLPKLVFNYGQAKTAASKYQLFQLRYVLDKS